MSSVSISRWYPLLFSLALPVSGLCDLTPEQWLLEQVRIGESSHKEELVSQSLYRLELIDANNPEVIAAQMRLALRQGNQVLAQQRLDKLQQLVPQSRTYRQAKMNLLLTQPETRQQLQQARLMATSGRLQEAKAQYDLLFQSDPPTIALTVEYWLLVGRLPGQEAAVFKQLQALDQQYPENVMLRMALARMLFSQNRDDEAYELLQKVAADPLGRSEAADLWLKKILSMPATPASVVQLKQFLRVFDVGSQVDSARDELKRQQTLLANPAYQSQLHGLALVEKGGSSEAIPYLQKALSMSPDDPQVLGALGLAYSRSGDRQQALKLFALAQKAEKNGFHSSKWQDLMTSTRYWLLLDEGEQALKAQHLAVAQQKYQQAHQLDESAEEALVGLGDVAMANKDQAAAEGFYQQVWRLHKDSSSAVRSLTMIYQQQSSENALSYLNNLSTGPLSNQLRLTIDKLQLDILKQQADTLVQQRQWQSAIQKYRRAQQLAPDDIWLTYHYARALRQVGQLPQADSLFSSLAQRQPHDLQQIYAYAIYLSSSDRTRQALAHLNKLPAMQWNTDMRELAQRLKIDLVLEQAQQQRDAGDEAGAIAALRQQPADTRIDLLLAEWATARGHYDEAMAAYRRIEGREPSNPDTWLGKIEIYTAQGEQQAVRQLLQHQPTWQNESVNSLRRVANAWDAVGEPQKAAVLFNQLKNTVQQQAAGQTKALVYRDAARLEQTQGEATLAQQDYQQAMVASGITTAAPQDDDSYTTLTRHHPTDDWLQRGIRSDAADLYRQQNVNASLAHHYWRSSGTGGISDYRAQDTQLQLEMPWSDGRAFLRSDTLQLDAGSFSSRNGQYYETFGTCHTQGCRGDEQQQVTGTSVAAGWSNDRWAADLGTTPMGFAVVDVVGGLAYSDDWNHIGWTVTASRRPISSSLLAFAGTRDPNTGTTWGGVRATGVSLSGSYDRGEANGVWADLSIHQLTGENVEGNQRERAMMGYYYKLINEDDRRVTIGLNTMLWHYQKDLSGYSLGQGGYYSPQRYLSLSLPVNYRQRFENWLFELGGAISLSHSKTNSGPRYPLSGLIPSSVADKYAIEEGSSSASVGYTLRAVAERRLSSRWILGAGVDIQHAKDYLPSHSLIYLRYSFADWQGDLDWPPQPPTPYADFK